MFERFKDKKGAVVILAAIATTALLGFTALAVDVGVILTSRNQLQNLVDSAALAAASKLDGGTHGDIVSKAQEYASYNTVLNQQVALQTNDIVIVDNVAMAQRYVQVTGYRTSTRGNPVSLLFARNFGFNTADVTATSKAGLVPIKGTEGVRPWAVRDKCLVSGEEGCEGFAYPTIGEPVTLKYGPQDNPEEEYWFGPVCMPPVNKGNPETGANAYRDLIEDGSDVMVETGDVLRVEPGNMAGPTAQGVNYLTSQDSTAYWDSSTNQVAGSSYENNQSPRIIKVVFYDPNVGIVGSPGQITITRIGAFFLEGTTGPPESNVTGRFMETVSTGMLDLNSQSRVYGVGLIE
jgi:Flp pilus assembly protein TadG